MFFALGGRMEDGETEMECLHREVKEEVGCQVKNPSHFKTFEGANHDNTKSLRMSCYLVELEGEIFPQSEIAECEWIDKEYARKGICLATMLEVNVIPELIKQKLL